MSDGRCGYDYGPAVGLCALPLGEHDPLYGRAQHPFRSAEQAREACETQLRAEGAQTAAWDTLNVACDLLEAIYRARFAEWERAARRVGREWFRMNQALDDLKAMQFLRDNRPLDLRRATRNVVEPTDAQVIGETLTGLASLSNRELPAERP